MSRYLSRSRKHIPNVRLFSPSSGGADPSPSHSCGEPLYALGGASVQDGTFQGVAFSFGQTILKTKACSS